MTTKLSDVAVGSIVKLNVNNTAREFIVVHQGKPSQIYDDSFLDSTILLMNDIYEARQWHSSDMNDYANSTIHSYLNSTFLNLFDPGIKAAIKQVKVPYRPSSGTSSSINSGASGLSAKIFLLSGYEMGWTSSNNQYLPPDGAKLAYFDSGTGTTANNKRIGYLDGIATIWWLRSPSTIASAHAWSVHTSGYSSNSNACSRSYGVRPALVLPASLYVSDDGNVTILPSSPGLYVMQNDKWFRVKCGTTVEPEPDPEQVVNYTMLYDQGDECAAVTGGWSAAKNAINPTYSVYAGNTKTSGRIVMQIPSGNGSKCTGITVIKKVAMNEYCKLFAVSDVDIKGAQSSRYGIAVGNADLYALIDNDVNVSYNTNSASSPILQYGKVGLLDVSGLTGEKYITAAIGAYNDNAQVKAMLYNMALFKPDNPSRLISATGIATAYSTPEAFATNASNRAAILSNTKAVKIMTLTCTGDLMYAILNNTDWITAIKANDKAYRIIMANPHWSKFVGIIPAAKELLGYTMLYDQGDECEAVTGGWADINKGSYGGTLTAATKNTNYVSYAVNASYKINGIRTSEPISLDRYDQLLLFSMVTGANYSLEAAHQSGYSATLSTDGTIIGYSTDIKNASTVNVIDVSSYTDARYCVTWAWNGSLATGPVNVSMYNFILLRADSWQTWSAKGGLTASYATLDTLLSDNSAMAILMSNRDAISYMISCTGTLMAAICNSETAMSALVNSPVAYDAAFENAHWYKFMTMCPVSLAAMESAPDAVQVPIKTNNTSPNGETIASSTYSGNDGGYTPAPWRVFDGNDAVYPRWRANTNQNEYIGEIFDSPIYLYKMHAEKKDSVDCFVRNGSVQYSNDGINWYNAAIFLNTQWCFDVILSRPVKAKYWRLFAVDVNDADGTGPVSASETARDFCVTTLQFYGKEVI